MALCPINCTTDLVGLPQESCKPIIRPKTISRFIFFPCNIELPETITPENIKPFFDDGDIVITRELAEITLAAPTYEEIRVSDCRPALRQVATREVTFRDFNAVTGSLTSPGTPDLYFDYDFWQDKVDSANRLRYGVVYCDGDVKIAKNEDGSYMTADMTAILEYITPANGGKTEYKAISVIFQGDPLNLTVKPSFNIIDAEIVI